MTPATQRKAASANPIAQTFEEQSSSQPHETRHNFKGHSGAKIVLHTQAAHSFVRKTAANHNSNDRLLRQADKQHYLGRLGISLPRVLASGTDDAGLAFFDMEYVPGRTVADAVLNAAPIGHQALTQAVARMLWLFRECRSAPMPATRFHGKIDEVVNASLKQTMHESVLNQIRQCATRLHACNWHDIPESPCHGDLTLENILIANERGIIFIDCDDPWVSSFWLDLGKLFQDLDGHWCVRRLYAPGTSPVHRANAFQKLELLGRHFRMLTAEADSALPARLPQLAALSLFRALPYVRENGLAEFICARINSVLT